VALLSRAAHPLHPPGGLERAVYHLAKHLRAQGVDTILLTRPATCDAAFPGEVVAVPYGGHAARHGRVLDRTLHYPRFARRLGEAAAALVAAGRVDVVHAQGLTALGYGRLRRRNPALRAPLVMNPQGMEEHKTRGLKRLALARLRRLSREAARLADRVIATDGATRQEVPRLLGVEPDRVVVLPNGIDAEEIRDATPAQPERLIAERLPRLAGATPLLLSVGRLEGYKGFGDVFAALQQLESGGALPGAWAWVVVGEGPERGALERSLGPLASHVCFAGVVPDALLHALYEAAHVFVHATRDEGSSLVTLEAMAHGRAVVATRAGGIPDKIVDGRTGRLVEPGDVEALGRALRELIADDGRRRALGESARAFVLERFAWPGLAARTIALYEELLRERRP
jgi:glycosyltransferase involved in cell wall biosynthesis